MDRLKRLISFLLLLSFVFGQAPFYPQQTASANPPRQRIAITAQDLERHIDQHLYNVPEFRFIAETAQAMGLRVYLFGGTASAFLHYAKWDLRRLRGDTRFQAYRFDYDFTNIFRSTQDLDIVIDGNNITAAQVEQFRGILENQFPNFVGSKTNWEVRLLRNSIGTVGSPGYKEALLDSYDFLNQNTDSNSTGLIEISTRPERHRILDLRHWQEIESRFLIDSLADRIQYFDSPTHNTTSRAARGDNPKILSVVRALTKAFQFELTFSPEVRAQLQEIINDFNPRDLSDYAKRWMIKNGKKLLQNAVDIEYAWNTLESFGLRQKLMQLDGVRSEESLAWWMNKEPLRSATVGRGDGRTARQIFRNQDPIIVSHETSTFLTYEAISRSHQGIANFFISRTGHTGETAAHGNGVYTLVGQSGARGTGFTIRMELDPNARLGNDFKIGSSNNMVIILNRSAVRIIQESLNVSPPELFRMVRDGMQFSDDDKGIYETLMRRARARMQHLDANDTQQIAQILREQLASYEPNRRVFQLMRDFNLRPDQLGLTPVEYFRALVHSHNFQYMAGQAGLMRIQSYPQIVRAVEQALASTDTSNLDKFVTLWIDMESYSPTWSAEQWIQNTLNWTLRGITTYSAGFNSIPGRVSSLMRSMPREEKRQIFSRTQRYAKRIAETTTASDERLGEYRDFLIDLALADSDFGSFNDWARIASSADEDHFEKLRIILNARYGIMTAPERQALVRDLRTSTSRRLHFSNPNLVFTTPIYKVCPSCFENVIIRDHDLMWDILTHLTDDVALWERMITNLSSIYSPGQRQTQISPGDLRDLFFSSSTARFPFSPTDRRRMYAMLLDTYPNNQLTRMAIGENLAEDFAHDWTNGWTDLLEQRLHQMETQPYGDTNLMEFISFVGRHHTEQRYRSLEPQILEAVRIADRTDNIQALEAACQHLVSQKGDHEAGPEFTWRYFTVIDELLQIIARRRNSNLLTKLSTSLFRTSLGTRSDYYTNAVMELTRTLRSGETLNALASNAQLRDMGADTRDITNNAYTQDTELLAEIRRRRRSSALLDMVHRLKRTDYPREFYSTFIRYVVELRSQAAIERITSSWFTGHTLTNDQMKSPVLMREAWRAAITLRSSQAIFNIFHYAVNDKPASVQRYYASAVEELLRRLIEMTRSSDNSERQFVIETARILRERFNIRRGGGRLSYQAPRPAMQNVEQLLAQFLRTRVRLLTGRQANAPATETPPRVNSCRRKFKD